MNTKPKHSWWHVARALMRSDWTVAAETLHSSRRHRQPLGRSLSRWLVPRLAREAERAWRSGNYFHAWNLMHLASEMAPRSWESWLGQQKNRLVEQSIADADENLKAGRVEASISILKGLSELSILDWRADRITSSAQLIQQAESLAVVGNYRAAIKKYNLAARQRPDLHYLPAKIRFLERGRGAAMIEQRVSESSTLDLLAGDPPEIHQVDALWQSRQADSGSATGSRSTVWETTNQDTNRNHAPNSAPPATQAERSATGYPQQLILWIDGIGGFRICLAAVNWLGRYVDDPHVDLPIKADLFRRHCRFETGSGTCNLLATGPTRLNGRRLPSCDGTKATLANRDRVELNGTVVLQFIAAKRTGGSHRLVMESGHRAVPGCDAILLMGQHLRIADSADAEIRVPGLVGEIILARHGDGLTISADGMEPQLDERPLRDPVRLPPDARVTTRQLSIQFEVVGKT